MVTPVHALEVQAPRIKPVYQWVNAEKVRLGTQYIAPESNRSIVWIYEGTLNLYQPQTQESVNTVVSAIPRTRPSFLAFWGNTNLHSFDDARWDTFLTNLGYLAQAAKQYEYIGILQDDEYYLVWSGINLYNPPSSQPTEYKKKVVAKAKEYARITDGLIVGSYGSWQQVEWMSPYKTFWKEVGKTQATMFFFEDAYTYRRDTRGVNAINAWSRNVLQATPCAGFDRMTEGRNQACRWLYLEQQ